MTSRRRSAGARRKAPVKRAGVETATVHCVVANAHLGDGRVMRRGDVCDLPSELARQLRDKGMVE